MTAPLNYTVERTFLFFSIFIGGAADHIFKQFGKVGIISIADFQSNCSNRDVRVEQKLFCFFKYVEEEVIDERGLRLFFEKSCQIIWIEINHISQHGT